MVYVEHNLFQFSNFKQENMGKFCKKTKINNEALFMFEQKSRGIKQFSNSKKQQLSIIFTINDKISSNLCVKIFLNFVSSLFKLRNVKEMQKKTNVTKYYQKSVSSLVKFSFQNIKTYLNRTKCTLLVFVLRRLYNLPQTKIKE